MLTVQTFVLGPYKSNCFVVYSIGTTEAIVVDPGYYDSVVADFITAKGLKVVAIFLTHAHIDHFSGAGFVKNFLQDKLSQNCKIYCHAGDAVLFEWSRKHSSNRGEPIPAHIISRADAPVDESSVFTLDGHKLSVLHLPGHTLGSCALYSPDDEIMFAGDTVFKDSIGRTDLFNSSRKEMLASLKKLSVFLAHRLDETGREMTVYTGHGEPTATYELQETLDYFITKFSAEFAQN